MSLMAVLFPLLRSRCALVKDEQLHSVAHCLYHNKCHFPIPNYWVPLNWVLPPDYLDDPPLLRAVASSPEKVDPEANLA